MSYTKHPSMCTIVIDWYTMAKHRVPCGCLPSSLQLNTRALPTDLDSTVLFFLVALASVSVSAQESSASPTSSGVAAPTSTAGIPNCVLQCSIQAGTTAGCAFSDPSCACSTTNGFQDAATACLQACTPEEQQAALGLQAALCGAASSGAFSDSVSATGSATTEAVSSSPSATSPLSSASAATTPLSSASVTRPATSASTSAPATSGSGTPAPANTSNAAMGIMRVGGEQAALFGAGVAVVGALLGAAMVL
ncbi:CFEM domain-containing protein [Pleurotus pulmonarius]